MRRRRLSRALATALEAFGVAVIAGALGWALHPAAGAVIAGAYLVALGWAVGRGD